MKKSCFLLILLLIVKMACSQEYIEEQEKRSWWYPSLNLLMAAPAYEFKDAIEKSVLWGFDINAAFKPIENANYFQPGVQFEFLFPTIKKDKLNGAKINTTSVLIKANLFTRMRFNEEAGFSPFLEGGFGLNLSSTSTTTKIIDEATFFEEFFLNQEDEIETVSLHKHDDASMNVYLGAGFLINQAFSVLFKYHYSPDMEFIKKDNIIINDREINYKPVLAPYKTFEVAIGISFEKGMKKMK